LVEDEEAGPVRANGIQDELMFHPRAGRMVGEYRSLSMEITLDHALAIEAKAMVALAFRNGPIEALHAGKPCAVCSGNPAVSHISDEEMKAMMKSAVNTLYRLLWQRKNDSEAYIENLALGQQYTMQWDDPELKKPVRKRPSPNYRNP
jgi:hypothetical protein